MRRTLICALVIATAALTGCNKSPGEKKLVVGFSQVGGESSWREAETKSIKDEAAKRNIELKFSDAQGSKEKQIQAIRGFIAQGVDAIILAPKVETGWDEVLEEAKERKIPVILVDRSIDTKDDSLYSTLIIADFIEEGRMAAEWLAKKTNGKANIVELQGSAGSAPANDRRKGFAKELEKHPDMKIIKTQDGKFELAGGKTVMEAFLKDKGTKIDAVYAHNDDMALGAIQAIEDAKKKPGQDIMVVSIDGVKGAFQAMVDGKLNCTIECNPLLGPAAFDAIEKIVAGKPVEKKTLMPAKRFEQATAKDDIGSRKY